MTAQKLTNVPLIAADPSVVIITEKAPTRAFSWLKAATTAFTFKTLCNQEKALVGTFSVITNPRMELFEALLSAVCPRVVTPLVS